VDRGGLLTVAQSRRRVQVVAAVLRWKRAREPAVQLWGEVEKVVGGLVWAMWGRSGAFTRE
jgi:hypothetical protein